MEETYGAVLCVDELQLILTRFNSDEAIADLDNYVDKLEGLVEKYNKAAREGNPLVNDSIYDACIDILQAYKPDSYLLKELWTADDETVEVDSNLDLHLITYPMLSIQTVKDITAPPVKAFKDLLPLGDVDVCVSIKENGHGGRAVYLDGKLQKATSRGRSTAGKDLTRQIGLILGDYIEDLDGHGLVELRYEVLLPFRNLEQARQYNPDIKSAFSGVASMIRDSATDEEVQLLDVVVYDIIGNNFDFAYLSEKLSYLEDCGFNVPLYFQHTITRRTLEQDIKDVILNMDMMCDDYDYYTDGVVLTIDDIELFNEYGAEDKYRKGNLALKMGRWKQDSYTGVIQEIRWEQGKSKITPVAILQDGVLTATGNTVMRIPLYAPAYILMLEAYPGNEINFRYGGEAGVVPITADGRLVTDKGLNID